MNKKLKIQSQEEIIIVTIKKIYRVPTICWDGQNPYGENYKWPNPTEALRYVVVKQK